MAGTRVSTPTLTWKTRSAAEEECTNILRRGGYEVGDVVTDTRHVAVLTALVMIHPHAKAKVGPGIADFRVAALRGSPGAIVSKDSIGFQITRIDGSVVDFSYMEAIYPSDLKKKVQTALRTAVHELRSAYRNERFAEAGPVRSDVSGDPFGTRAEATVIYRSPTFAQLAYRFADAEGGWDAIAIDSGKATRQVGDVLTDEQQEERWLTFFKKYARMELATKSEGASRSRSDETDWEPQP